MQEIWQRGRQPLLVGGTMLYFHALTLGHCGVARGGCRACARSIDAQAASDGWAAVHRELERVDPPAAARIHVNDPQRIQRALEVYRVTGEPITRLQQYAHVGVRRRGGARNLRSRRSSERVLHRRIEARFRRHARRGVSGRRCGRLRERSDLTAEHPSMRAVGYRQVWRYLAGQCGLEEAKERSDCGDAATCQASADVAAAARTTRNGSIPCILMLHGHDSSALSRGRICSVVIRSNVVDAAVLAFNRYMPGRREVTRQC